MGNWHDITRDPEYQSLSDGAKSNLKQEFFNRTIAKDPEFGALSDDAKRATFLNFFQTPDDTGQGQITSTIGSAARGFGEIIPGAIQGAGALTPQANPFVRACDTLRPSTRFTRIRFSTKGQTLLALLAAFLPLLALVVLSVKVWPLNASPLAQPLPNKH